MVRVAVVGKYTQIRDAYVDPVDQRTLIYDALDGMDDALDPHSNFMDPDTNRRSLQRDLKGLVTKGLIQEIGTGPTDPNRAYRLLEL